MNTIERVALFMHEHQLTLVTAESCTAGLIAATLADIPGAGGLLDCAFVVYSVAAKRRCLGVPQSTLARHNLTSEAVARDMALGAARKSPANVAVANTGVTDATDDRIPAGTQCYSWVFKTGPADASPIVYTATRQFSGSRNQIRQASAEFALQGIVEHFLRHHAGRPKGRGA
ncbi:CinA family protein [Achromobacter xylosoxidans]|uniref:CinA family protein n=1 Tax=Alcaligenes xylosoxydans xylosoxydans TaxID=85698 RepID=UPI0006AC04C8|nr:CinA family protein [Achromobacter xylosoxidans]KOQ19125.1 ompetence-damaged protein [Achromobacter xylosoxidans]KOQ23701.1 ompetence-damaged protein [Achromobacter xylosoxidans]KOQ32656.1 ompetence-damaged protein [Achromobacter xylosoxidans]KOQ39594.1 ompetence-damaged protein [Achromobacter xylosoxidans]KOQ43405.1 ompetence-damaged protein [Achromobacter xylosoxidans]